MNVMRNALWRQVNGLQSMITSALTFYSSFIFLFLLCAFASLRLCVLFFTPQSFGAFALSSCRRHGLDHGTIGMENR